MEEGFLDAQLFVVHIADNHFTYIIHFFTIGMALNRYTSQKKKELVVCVTDFLVITGNLYKMGADEILRRYVTDCEWNSILVEGHGGAVRGHYVGKAMA